MKEPVWSDPNRLFSVLLHFKKREEADLKPASSLYSFGPAERLFRIFGEIGFRGSADRAFPVLRDVFERGSGLYATVRIALGRVIDPATAQAFVLF